MSLRAKRAKLGLTAAEATDVVTKAMDDPAEDSFRVFTPVERLEVLSFDIY